MEPESSETGDELKSGNGPSKIERTVFPPPNLWYKSTMAAARDDVWAYSAGGMIIVVKPKVPEVLLNGGSEKAAFEMVPEVVDNEAADVEAHLDNIAPMPEQKKRTSDDSRKWPSFSILGEQRNKYTCLSFCQTSLDYLPVSGAILVSGCEGGLVQVWNLEDKACVFYHDSHKGHQVTGLDWSTRDHSLIYSIDEAGTMIVWNVEKNTLRSLNFGKNIPTCLQACPEEDNIVSFGTKSGLVYIVETTGTGKVLSKARHEEEVVVTAWKPPGEWDAMKHLSAASKQNKFPILASCIQSMKLPTVRIWNSRGKDIATVQVWEKDTKSRPFKVFGPAAWAKDPNSGKLMLLTSGRHGEIAAWTGGPLHEFLHSVHNHNAIFAMVQCGDILWSLSYEPIIVGYNLRKSEIECVIPTFKGACSISPSPVDPTRVAIGGTDSVIRVLKCTPGYPSVGDACSKVPVNSHKLRGKITAVTWHPKRDNCIAFGTDEGALGIYELKDNNRYAMWFERRAGGVVYTVTFGPPVSSEQPTQSEAIEKIEKDQQVKDEKDHLMLYACGGGGVYMIHPTKSTNHLINVSRIIEKSNPVVEETGLEPVKAPYLRASDVVWTPDYSLMAVGYNDGRIELYAPPFLKLKCWIKCHLRAIQYLSWRPFDFGEGVDSKDRWLVSASNDGTARLYNLGELFDSGLKKERENEEAKMVISSEATLQEHGCRVLSCAWSPHDKNLLVTVSYDCTAIVWNIEDGTHVARYMEHQDRLVACCFHPTDPFKVITVSDELTRDFTIQIWDYRDHPFRKNLPRSKPPCVAVPIKAANDVSKIFNAIQEKSAAAFTAVNGGKENRGEIHFSRPVQILPEKIGKSKTKSKLLMPCTTDPLVNSPHVMLCDELQYLVDKKPLKERIEAENKQPDGGVLNGDETASGDGTYVSESKNIRPKDPTLALGLLGNRKECHKQLEYERNYQEDINPTNAAMLSHWLGDPTWLEKCIKTGKVTEFMLPIAACMNRSLHLKALDSYASSLIKNEEYIKAAHYFNLCGKQDRAIEVLVNFKLYKEAVAMMKAILPEEDPRMKDVMRKWAFKLIRDGNFELAAKISCSIEDYSTALTAIEKRPFSYAYKAGCFVASKMNDDSKLTMFGVNFILDGILKGAYNECYEVLDSYPKLKWLKCIVKVHQTIFGCTKYVSEVKDFSGFKMWEKVMENCWEETSGDILSICDDMEPTEVQKKISGNILVSIAQNDNDAMQIITKTLSLIIFGTSVEFAVEKAVDCIKLAKIWHEKKNLYLYFAIVMSFSTLVPSLNLNSPLQEFPIEFRVVQFDALVRLLKSIILKASVKNPEKEDDPNLLIHLNRYQEPLTKVKEFLFQEQKKGPIPDKFIQACMSPVAKQNQQEDFKKPKAESDNAEDSDLPELVDIDAEEEPIEPQLKISPL